MPKEVITMPETETTLTGYKNRIRQYSTQHGHQIGERTIKTVARRLHERQVRMSDLDLERILMYSDPTPRDAIRNIERQAA